MSANAPRIDSHHHLWHYNPQQYSWIDDAMKVIRRDFLAADIEREIGAAGIDGVVTVQARQDIPETEWLLEEARQFKFIRGVVGWVPMMQPDVADVLARLVANPKLKAVRHVVQGEPDPEFILRPDFNQGIRTLKQFGLVYDILIYERQLKPTIHFVDLHPDQVFVLDHIAKPQIKDHLVSPWRENIQDLARRENVYCKISGMVTEADYERWTEADLDPYFDFVLSAFGPHRLMFGSDWPVCLVATNYANWFRLVSAKIAGLSDHERDRILGETAIEAYGLG